MSSETATTPIIKVHGIAKVYRHARVGSMESSLREQLSILFRRPWRILPGLQHRDHADDVRALDPLSFTVARGERLGLIGRNGSGKSTLLKILARITPPSSGEAVIHGSVASILEVGTGFHPELTGYENIFLNGAILGLRRAYIQQHFDAIVAFSELADYLDLPVKRYSSGMYVRLAFSVAAFLQSQVLLVDEVLAVGDQSFRRKCLDKMEDESRRGRTVIIVSHDLDTIRRLCDRSLVLDHGRLLYDGTVDEAIRQYRQLCGEDV